MNPLVCTKWQLIKKGNGPQLPAAAPGPEMNEPATRAGFDLFDVDLSQNDRFIEERMQAYIPVAKRVGLIK